MQYFRRHAQLGLCSILVCLLLGGTPTRGQSTPAVQPHDCIVEPGECTRVGSLWLRNTSVDAAKEVCTEDWKPACAYKLIETLGAIDDKARCNPRDPRAMEALILRQQITERVFTASLQVDGFLSEIDSETGQIRAVHDDLTDRQTAKVASSTLGSAIGTGGGAVGSTLALGSTAAATAGNWFGATFGTLGAVFGFVGYFQGGHSPKACFPSLGQKPNQCTVPPPVDQCDPKNKTPPANGCSPVMLYHLVFPEAKANADVGFHSDYDLPIENYLRDKRRRETLINPWIIEAKNLAEKKKKKKPEDPTDSNNVLKSAEPFLFASNKKPLKVSIDDLTNRANKLGDLRAVVARMNRDLSRLMEDLATGLQCHGDGTNTQ